MKKLRRTRAVADTRLRVDPAGDWKSCTKTLPKACKVLGTISIGTSTGALVRLASSRNYVKVTQGRIEMLNQRRIETLLDAASRASPAQDMISIKEWERS